MNEVQKSMKKAKARDAFETFINEVAGISPEESEHLKDTPERVVDAYYDELFRGLYENPREHLETTFTEGVSDDLIVVDNIEVQSMCAHHFLPFRGKAHIGYIPDEEIVGLSKFSRVVDGYARRPQVQERLTAQIADAIEEELSPSAVIVVIEAEHECMTVRGVQDSSSMTRTSALRGKARESEDIKSEFFEMVDNA